MYRRILEASVGQRRSRVVEQLLGGDGEQRHRTLPHPSSEHDCSTGKIAVRSGELILYRQFGGFCEPPKRGC